MAVLKLFAGDFRTTSSDTDANPAVNFSHGVTKGRSIISYLFGSGNGLSENEHSLNCAKKAVIVSEPFRIILSTFFNSRLSLAFRKKNRFT